MVDWLLEQHGVFLYLLLFLMLLGGAVGLPIPEDVPLVLAGVLVQTERAELTIILPVCYVGILLGDMIIFSVGRAFGTSLFQKSWFRKRFSSSRIRRLRFSLEKRSLLMILIARHLFYLRTATFLTCGAVRMSPIRFFIADSIAALISAPLMIAIGYLAAEHYKTVFSQLGALKWVTLAISVIAVVAYVLYRRRSRQETAAGPSEIHPGENAAATQSTTSIDDGGSIGEQKIPQRQSDGSS